MPVNLRKDSRFLEFQKLLEELQRDYNVSREELLTISEDILIPVSAFSDELSSFETISKYLLENKSLKLSTAAKLTGRSKQGVYQAYKSSKEKFKGKLKDEESKYSIPVSVISEKKYSVLEAIVKFLREEHNLSYAEISRLIARDQRTVWTVYNRSKKK